MATTPCMPSSGPHHHLHTDSPRLCVMTPRPFFMLRCERRDARQLHVRVPHTLLSHPLWIQCMCLCADLSGGTWLPLSLSSSLRLFTTISCGGEGGQLCKAAMHSSHAQHSRSGSEMSIANLAVRWHAICCWMLMQSTRSITPVRHLTHLHSSTAFPFPILLTMRHTTTPQRRR